MGGEAELVGSCVVLVDPLDEVGKGFLMGLWGWKLLGLPWAVDAAINAGFGAGVEVAEISAVGQGVGGEVGVAAFDNPCWVRCDERVECGDGLVERASDGALVPGDVVE